MYAREAMFAGGSNAHESLWKPGIRSGEPFNVMSMASNMSHEQRHAELDLPEINGNLIETIVRLLAAANTKRSNDHKIC